MSDHLSHGLTGRADMRMILRFDYYLMFINTNSSIHTTIASVTHSSHCSGHECTIDRTPCGFGLIYEMELWRRTIHLTFNAPWNCGYPIWHWTDNHLIRSSKELQEQNWSRVIRKTDKSHSIMQ